MEEYYFYNAKYGIKLLLTLNKGREELVYKNFGIKDKYRGNFCQWCKNGWLITSSQCPAIDYSSKVLCLSGTNSRIDNSVIVMLPWISYAPNENDSLDMVQHAQLVITLEDVERTFHELVQALDGIGNDSEKSEAEMFLDM